MKLLATSDLHNRHDWFDWLLKKAPEYDAVIIAGDLIDMFQYSYPQIQYLGRWADEFKKIGIPLVLCCGNHDLNQYPLAQLFTKPGKNEPVLDDFVIKACGWEHWMDALAEKTPLCVVGGMTRAFSDLNLVVTSLAYEPSDEGLNLELMKGGARLRRKTAPAPTWIVLHHVPPVGEVGREDKASPVFRDWIEEYQPKLAFCGHDHKTPFKNNTCREQIGFTQVFNVGHDPKNNYPCHVVIDTETMNFQWNH